MTDTEVDRAIEEAKRADRELFIRDENGKVSNGGHTESTRSSTGEGRQQPLDRPRNQIQTLRPITNRNKPETVNRPKTLDQGWNDRHNRKQNAPFGRSPANSRRGNVEDRQFYLDSRN